MLHFNKVQAVFEINFRCCLLGVNTAGKVVLPKRQKTAIQLGLRDKISQRPSYQVPCYLLKYRFPMAITPCQLQYVFLFFGFS